jgi:hypothetical protein
MGRQDVHGDPDEPIQLIVHHLPFEDGDYDSGGAYWGAGEPLWRAVELDGPVEFFLRAKDRWEALEAVRAEYPNVHIVDTPREAWFEDFVTAYEVAALWSSTDTVFDKETGGEKNVELDEYELHPDTKAEMREDCRQFVDYAEPLLLKALKRNGYTAERAGHDYWLTRNHHGAGFWDRGLGELGDKLTEAAHNDGSVELYLGTDDLVRQGSTA